MSPAKAPFFPEPPPTQIESQPSYSRFGEDHFSWKNGREIRYTDKTSLHTFMKSHFKNHSAQNWQEIAYFDAISRNAFWTGTVAMVAAIVLEGNSAVTAKTLATGLWGISWTVWLGSASVSVGLLADLEDEYNENQRRKNPLSQVNRYRRPPVNGLSVSISL